MERLKRWKDDQEKPLILQGARQVGKTYVIREFAKENYENWVELNFILHPNQRRIFEGDLSVEQILLNLSLYSDFEMDQSKGRPLIFLDEIQACAEARTALKSFQEDGRIDIIASGSLLGIQYKKVPSFPTGYVTYETMYPMDFEEFLWANEVQEKVFHHLRTCFDHSEKVIPAINERMHELFRTYIVTGGMPAAVQEYIDHHQMHRVLRVQRDIVVDYRNDIAKYAEGSEKVKATACYDSLPSQLGKENKKFMFSRVEKGGKRVKYESSIQWLIDANAVLPCRRLSAVEPPLKSFIEPEDFKLYLSDSGLLMGMLEEGIGAEIMAGGLNIYRGAIYENLIAQTIVAAGKELYYYNRNNSLEIDFVLSDPQHPTLLEVKAGNNQAKSLRTLMRDPRYAICKGVKLMGGNVGDTSPDGIVSLPVYMAMFL